MARFIKLYDVNRAKKVYPLLRVKPNYVRDIDLNEGGGGSGIDVEVAILPFNNSEEETYTFGEGFLYQSIPIVVATPSDDNVNIFISALTTESVTIQSSAPFTGTVHLHIYEDLQ